MGRVSSNDMRNELADLSERQRPSGLRISRAWIEEMSESMNITDVCEGTYGVVLEPRSGDLDFRSPCPLPGHIDKSPSFFVNSKKNIFICFGCGRKGGLLKFVQTMEGLSFRESVLRLSDITGVGEGGDENQIVRAMRDIRDAADDFLGTSEEVSLLPGGMGLIPFLVTMAVRLREYEARAGADIAEVSWVDSVYARLDQAVENLEGPDERAMAKLWRSLSKEISKRRTHFASNYDISDRTEGDNYG